jgi:hypothetical protein
MAHQLREGFDKWEYMKLKSFCTTKEMVYKLKRPPTEWVDSMYSLAWQIFPPFVVFFGIFL